MFQVTFPSSDSVILQYSPIPDEYFAKTKPLFVNCDMQWFSIYYSYLSRLDIAFKMSNRSKQARIVPETPDNSSSDDEQEQEGEELQVSEDSFNWVCEKRVLTKFQHVKGIKFVVKA